MSRTRLLTFESISESAGFAADFRVRIRVSLMILDRLCVRIRVSLMILDRFCG